MCRVFDLAAGWEGIKVSSPSCRWRTTPFIAVGIGSISPPISRASNWLPFRRLLLLVIGFPLAYGMARAPRRWQPALFMLVVLPFWTSFLIRIYAWVEHSPARRTARIRRCSHFRLVDEPPAWLLTDTAVYIGIVYSYLPFMVLPIYAPLEKMDETLIEAATDLGCPRWKVVLAGDFSVVASRPVAAGALLCFIPIVGEFVIPDLLGGSSRPC